MTTQSMTDAEWETQRATAISAYYRTLSRARFAELVRANRRGNEFDVSVRHEVGFGGCQRFTVRNVGSKEAAIECVRKQLKGETIA